MGNKKRKTNSPEVLKYLKIKEKHFNSNDYLLTKGFLNGTGNPV
jgi:hypothetical protein